MPFIAALPTIERQRIRAIAEPREKTVIISVTVPSTTVPISERETIALPATAKRKMCGEPRAPEPRCEYRIAARSRMSIALTASVAWLQEPVALFDRAGHIIWHSRCWNHRHGHTSNLPNWKLDSLNDLQRRPRYRVRL